MRLYEFDEMSYWYPTMHFRIHKGVNIRGFGAERGKIHWTNDGVFHESEKGVITKWDIDPQELKLWNDIGNITEIEK